MDYKTHQMRKELELKQSLIETQNIEEVGILKTVLNYYN